MSSALLTYLQGKAAQKQKVFVAYLTVGDPNLQDSEQLIRDVIQAGADIIELGVPFSDPVGDGPTNQKASDRALAHNTSLAQVLEVATRIHQQSPQTPLVIFSYYNPLFQMGLDQFAWRAKAAGVSGALVVDLPPEEAQSYSAALAKEQLGAVFLASPTTATERLQQINQLATGFVYYVSRTGVTGAQNELSASLRDEVQKLRAHVQKPIIVGFGISTPTQAHTVAGFADGVVVGSALVKLVEENQRDSKAMQRQVSELARQLADAVHKS